MQPGIFLQMARSVISKARVMSTCKQQCANNATQPTEPTVSVGKASLGGTLSAGTMRLFGLLDS